MKSLQGTGFEGDIICPQDSDLAPNPPMSSILESRKGRIELEDLILHLGTFGSTRFPILEMMLVAAAVVLPLPVLNNEN